MGELVSQVSDEELAAMRRLDPLSVANESAIWPMFGEQEVREFEASPRPMRIFERDTLRYLAVNDAALTLYGYTREEFLSLKLTDIRHPDEHADLYAAQRRAVGQIARWAMRRHVTKNGEVLDVETVTQNILFNGRKAQLCLSMDVSERRRHEQALRRGAALANLLESLARAANEAVTPEAAMSACLELICAYGGWVLGRVALYGEGESAAPRSVWHTPNPQRYAEFIRESNRAMFGTQGIGVFLGRVLREQAVVWVENFRELQGFKRAEAATRDGLNSAFGFPIVARGTVVAVIEVFSEDSRSRDPLTIGAAQSIASQLARIVEREQAHRADARMAAIVESSQDAIISSRLDGTIVTWNAGAERLLGSSAAEMIGRNVKEIMPTELVWRMPLRRELLRQGLPIPAHESIRVAKDGRRIHVSTSAAPIRDANGEIWGAAAIVRDITEQKRVEQALRESEERFRQIAENIDQVFWIDNQAIDGNIYVSPAYEKIWGRSSDTLKRNPNDWKDAIHPEDIARVHASFAALAKGRHLDIEYRIVRPDGSLRWIRDRSYPMKSDGESLVCGIAEDITERRLAEQARLAQAVMQRDALVREVHHRIKNSLQGVIGLLGQKARRNPGIAPALEETIGQLQSVALVYGLQETQPDGLLNLTEVLSAIIASAEELIGGQVDRINEIRSRRPACLAGGDAVSVAFALNELVFNALKHQRAPAGKKRARVMVRETEHAVEIRIGNRGRLPKGFDFAGGCGTGHGLGLVRTLLGAPGSTIVFNGNGKEVEAVLELRAPLLVAQQPMRSEEGRSDIARKEG